MSFKKLIVAACASVLALFAAAAMAHHSAAQFDFGQRVTIEGTVKQFNVTNPHTWAVVELKDDKRGTRDAQYEGHSASHFYRAGYTRDMVKVGDKISILIAPRRDGEVHAVTRPIRWSAAAQLARMNSLWVGAAATVLAMPAAMFSSSRNNSGSGTSSTAGL